MDWHKLAAVWDIDTLPPLLSISTINKIDETQEYIQEKTTAQKCYNNNPRVPEYNLIVDEVFKQNKSMELKLTKEAVKKMFHMWTNKNEPDFIPTLQIVYVKELFTLSSSAVSLSVVYLRRLQDFFFPLDKVPLFLYLLLFL